MKLVVFAHIPPPAHGQSAMVELLLEGLGGDARRRDREVSEPGGPALICYHVNARFSNDLAAIGRFQWIKLMRLPFYCAEALYCRFRFGATVLYYIPAPAKRVALYRDWLVMLLCRPFFRRVVFHWHSSGLGIWLQRSASAWERGLTQWLLGKPDLSLILGTAGDPDAVALRSRAVRMVPNGIADPCIDYDQALSAERAARLGSRVAACAAADGARQRAASAPVVFRVLFLSLCTREKGLFDTLEAVRTLNRRLKSRCAAIQLQLVVAGTFSDEGERREFERWLAPDPADAEAGVSHGRPLVRWAGYATGGRKSELFRECDCFCFPTYYAAESFPLVILEAMAYGMDVVATRWRNIPEILPPEYAGLVDPRSPDGVADALERWLTEGHGDRLRRRFLENFTLGKHLSRLRQALTELGGSEGNAKSGRE